MAILSFRSGNYDRLEGGIGRNRVGGMKRFGWKKFAVVLVGVVWLFGRIRFPSGGMGTMISAQPAPESIYKFNNSGPSLEYEDEVFKMTQPGLSSFVGNPEGAARSLDVLLDEAVRVVPRAMHGCTPLTVKATAGLCGGREDTLVISFSVTAERWSGGHADEDMYAWITANYL
ncbi:hypothetical protein K443DRAFT_7734 [Laccaria amethystina LaAM-08-1]|uniref:guanosine-diphosphatase n=1 Tax=Laccaria amethystina LaAM-08-1 TaxID=1095629 RepID=A0A0C9WQ54_9AGAR|nr:hypothetical protein K443DRAFT_7734 [Laccaria amethystina LaAM-08-1]